MATTSSAPLAALNASATVNVTTVANPAFFAGAVGTAVGFYVTPSPDFKGRFVLTRHISGYEADVVLTNSNLAETNTQIVLQGGEQTLLGLWSPAPFANPACTDSATLMLTGYSSGSLTLSLVQ